MNRPFIKERLFCPGPTPVPLESQLAAINTSVYHRTESFYKLFLDCRKLIAPLFGTKSLPLILTSSGTGAMESAVVNLTSVDDQVITICGGKFGERWGKIAEAYGCKNTVINVDWGEIPREEKIIQALKLAPETKAVFFQANETSTGVSFPLESLVKCIKENSKALVVIDAISALGANKIEMDNWGIDCLISGSQKGFGIPPGLSFIALSESTWDKITDRSRFYFDLKKEKKGQDKGVTAWTPATSLVASLQVSLKKMHEIGIENIYNHHAKMARGVRAGVEAIGLKLLAKNNYSHSLTSFYSPDNISAEKIITRLKNEYGAIFAGGQDHLKGKIIRLAHLGFSDRFDVISGMAALEFALKDEGYNIKIGTGVAHLMQSISDNTAK